MKISIETQSAIAFTITALGYCAYNDIPLLSCLIAYFPAWILSHIGTYIIGE